MRAATRRCKLWGLVGVLAVGAMSVEVDAAPRWRKVETPHFEVYSAASKAETREIIRDLELFHQTVLQVFALKPQSERRTRIVIFGRERHLDPYKPEIESGENPHGEAWEGEQIARDGVGPPDDSLSYDVNRKRFTPAGPQMMETPRPVRLNISLREMHAARMNAMRAALQPPRGVSRQPVPGKVDAQHAYSVVHPDQALIVLSGEDEWENTKAVLFGRYMRNLLQQCGLTEPSWFLEGMAEMLTSFGIRRDTTVVGQPDGELIGFMRELGYFMPWEEFFAMAADSRAYGQLGNRDLFAAQAWLLVHYCYFSEERSPEWRQALLAWIAEVQRGEGDMVELMQRHLGVTPAELTAELQTYCQRAEFSGLVLERPERWAGDRVALERASEEEAEAALLDVRVRVSRDPEAVQELEARLAAANAAGETDVAALELLGVAAMLRGDATAQVDYWGRAAAAGSADPAVVRHEAVAGLRAWVETEAAGAVELIGDEQAVVWRTQLEAALRLDPADEVTLRWLGWLEGLAETPSVENMNRVQRAVVAGMAQPDGVMMAVAIMQARVGDEATAREIVTSYGEDWETWKWRALAAEAGARVDDGGGI
ncbi:hypothetical protein [Actomonas aquatica]|uniref:DUF1570 domain-containing protein n=1 Tax=Actomonas aquatica TaxID=2866162 RepID=A0ABZ1CCG6_9BACT|nr:hypothetical protein [Opitutus sp. WL0086]WRQ89352.1 hypothetical protein K1X11_008020 [Opitutus sp. WL0086]